MTVDHREQSGLKNTFQVEIANSPDAPKQSAWRLH